MDACWRAAALLLSVARSLGENSERGCKLPDAPSALVSRGSLCKLLLLLPATDAAPPHETWMECRERHDGMLQSGKSWI